MAKIHFIEHNGTERVVEAQPGESVMEAAIGNGIPGIDADCGGACACATCHVFVDEKWLDKVGPVQDCEDGMLSVSNDRRPNSRLACQIQVSDELDGLVVTTPEFQF
ncbi:(2Fe-2S)-binding protein [Proteobacteria bacterium 005FR1]|nr:(2Fe-2S)-binding protein [Proteobacteria bacterium 005FR1]